MMQPHAELNAHALHELLSGEPGGYQRWQSQGLPYQPWTDRGLTQTLVWPPRGCELLGANQLRSLLRR